MSDEEIRIAIAGACGWKEVTSPIDPNYNRLVDPSGKVQGSREPHKMRSLWLFCIPDYPNDLNAILTAKETLNGPERRKFGEILCELMSHQINRALILYSKYPWSGDDVFVLSHATARIQAEAFLRVKRTLEAQ